MDSSQVASPAHSITRRRIMAGLAAGGGALIVDAVDAEPASAAADSNVGVSLRDFGAVGDGAADDGPALGRALDAIAAARGGVLVVPPGKYRIATSVNRSFTESSEIVIRGHGSASQLIVATGAGSDALILGGPECLLFEDLVFSGTPGRYPDARTALRLDSCLMALLSNCHFYGIACGGSGGPVVHVSRCDLRIRNTAFRGCTGSSFNGIPVLLVENWLGLTVEDTEFIDFGTLNGTYFSKTSQPSGPWIRVTNISPIISTAYSRGVYLRNVRMDEGAQVALDINPTAGGAINSARVDHVEIVSCMTNVSGISAGLGHLIDYTERVTIRDTWYGFTSTGEREAIRLKRVGSAVLDHVRCDQLANVITADSSTGSLTVIESVYKTLNSEAAVTNIVNRGHYRLPLLTIRVKDGEVDDDDFPAIPPDGTLALDRANERLYARVNGAWKFATLTGPTPFAPPDIAGLKAWFQADAITGLVDGNAVSSWVDSSSQSGPATQSDPGKRPVYRTNVLNGKPVVRFDGANDFLSTAPFAEPLAQPNTVVIVGQTTRPKTGDAFFDGSFSGAHLVDTDGTNYRIYAGAGVSATPADTLAHIFSAKFNGASSSLTVDGGRRYTGDVGSRSLARLTLGARGDGVTRPLGGDLAEVIVYDSALSDGDLTRVETYLKSKYGLVGAVL